MRVAAAWSSANRRFVTLATWRQLPHSGSGPRLATFGAASDSAGVSSSLIASHVAAFASAFGTTTAASPQALAGARVTPLALYTYTNMTTRTGKYEPVLLIKMDHFLMNRDGFKYEYEDSLIPEII